MRDPAGVRPWLLDLFCKAGGAAYGYHQAGFDVVGIDVEPQPHYPYTFVQADAFEYCTAHGHKFDAIHASPPCQFASIMRNLPWLKDNDYPALILPTRDMLRAIARPFVIENVWGARYGAKGLRDRGLEAHGMEAGWLCGGMFGRPFYRHRLFETPFLWLAPAHPKHQATIRGGRHIGGRARDDVLEGSGNLTGKARKAAAMGIDWMTGNELSQALPPAYTEYMGRQLLRAL